MKRLGATVLLILALAAPGASAQVRQVCSYDDETALFRVLDNARNWDDLYRLYQGFARCDDGAPAEGISDRIATLLADHWDQTGQLVTLTRHDPGFRSFVLRHVDELMTLEQAATIRTNARQHCPEDGADLCADIDRQLDL